MERYINYFGFKGLKKYILETYSAGLENEHLSLTLLQIKNDFPYDCAPVPVFIAHPFPIKFILIQQTN